MEIRFYSMNGYEPDECLGIIDNYSSFNFTKSFKKVGSWSLKGYLTSEVSPLLQPRNLMWVSPQICGLIEGVDFNTDEEGTTSFEAYGSELKNILSYRILEANYNTDTSIVKPIDYWMRHIVNENAGKACSARRRLLTSIDYSNENVTPDCSTIFLYGDGLLDDLTSLCVYNDCADGMQIGFDVECEDAKYLTFKVCTGEDRRYESTNPLIISREYDNAAYLDYVRSIKNTVNVVTIVGDDNIGVTTNGEEAYTGINRVEKFVEEEELSRTITHSDGSETQMDEDTYKEKLLSKAYTHTQADINSLESQMVLKTYGLPDYSQLGAMVTIVDKDYNLRANDWISEINFIDEQGEIEVNYTVGQDIQAKYLTEVK